LGTQSEVPSASGDAVAVCDPSTNQTGCYHSWDIDFFSQSADDYGGTFIAQANTIGNWRCSVPDCTGLADGVLILPMNIDLGRANGFQVWFQFTITFGLSCTRGDCSSVVSDFGIWDNPTNATGGNISYNDNPIWSPTGYTPGLPYTPGDGYEWHFYPTTPTRMVFLIEDTTTGNYWFQTFTVPSETLIYDTSLFSPSAAIETYIDPGTPSLTGVPTFQFFEGNLLCDIVCGSSSIYGSASQWLVTCTFCSTTTGTKDGFSLGLYQSFVEDFNLGQWYWTIFQAGSQVPVSISLNNDASSEAISTSNDFAVAYPQPVFVGGSTLVVPFVTDYESVLEATGGASLTVPSFPHDSVAISGESTDSSNLEYWCLVNGCSPVSIGSGSGASVSYYYYDLLNQTAAFSIVGGGSPSPPKLSYKGAPAAPGSSDSPASYGLTLTSSSQNFSTLWNSTASVTNPLGSSDSQERWWTGTDSWVTDGAYAIPSTVTYYDQYYLTTEADPTSGGSVSPGPGWYDAGAFVPVSETANAGWKFLVWIGSGPGSCFGLCSSVTMDSSVIETADFVQLTKTTTTLACATPVTVGTTSLCTATVSGASGSTDGETVTFGSSSFGSFNALNCALSSGSCYVYYDPLTVSGSPHTITATYSGDANNAGSEGTFEITVDRAPTTTTLVCATPVAVGTPSLCVVTVSGAFGSTDGEMVSFTASGPGTFNSTTCNLSSGSCGVDYTPATNEGSPQTINATYGGDTNNQGSYGSASLAVTAGEAGVPEFTVAPGMVAAFAFAALAFVMRFRRPKTLGNQ
jgi:hypothetical protein